MSKVKVLIQRHNKKSLSKIRKEKYKNFREFNCRSNDLCFLMIKCFIKKFVLKSTLKTNKTNKNITLAVQEALINPGGTNTCTNNDFKTNKENGTSLSNFFWNKEQ